MPINLNEIEIGCLYKTEANQERIVLQITTDGSVQYTARGGNVKNKFDVMYTSQPQRFAEACSEKIRKLSSIEFDEIKELFEKRGLI